MINKLTQKVHDLDIVLGGHDHCSDCLNINDTMLCKSGTDFREFSIIEVKVNCTEEELNDEPHENITNFEKKLIMRREKVVIDSSIEPHEKMKSIIDNYYEEISKKMEYIAGITGVDIDARFDQIRVKETNV